jgi:hypothetical protein
MGWAACFRRLGMVAAGLNLRRAADRAPTGEKTCIAPQLQSADEILEIRDWESGS